MRAATLGIVFLLAASCGPPPPPINLERINLARIEPTTLLPGSRLRFIGSGFLRGETMQAHFEGRYAGRTIDGRIDLEYVSSTEQALTVDSRFVSLLGADEGTFQGDVTLSVTREGHLLEDTEEVGFVVQRTLTPVLLQLDSVAVAFMEAVAASGRGFLLPGEGQTRFLFTGTFTPDGSGPQPLETVELPVEVDSRQDAAYRHTPEILGLVTGVLDGDVSVENEHLGGEVVTGGSLPVRITIIAPALASASPSAASRGQRVELLGRGFIPDDAPAAQSTSLELTGTFTTPDGTVTALDGPTALEIFPSYEEPGVAQYVIRPERNAQNQLEGLGATPGVFDGRVIVRLRREGAVLEGPPWTGTFTILPTRQVVFLKYLDSFSDGLRRFGLRNVEREIREQVMEVCIRDFAPYNVEFREERPTDYVDYSVLELSAVDPNGAGLFGLDNTEGKDEGNIRLNDVVGGRNAESEEQGYYAFGGVFVESFLSFSPQSEAPSPLSTPRFDEVFAGIVPELGGEEVAAGEFPGGDRDREVADAIRTLGKLIGNTVVHEIGHSLGLAAVATGFHHDGTTPRLIMNPGSARPFEERAELDGQGPGIWGSRDGDYLQDILPRP